MGWFEDIKKIRDQLEEKSKPGGNKTGVYLNPSKAEQLEKIEKDEMTDEEKRKKYKSLENGFKYK